MFHPKKILVLAPHTDDGELGCGASIARFSSEGASVWYAAFSTCAESLPHDLPSNTLEEECRKATSVLGIPASNLRIFDFRVREFPASRQQLLDTLRSLDAELKPDLVLLPGASDIHQDHETIHREGLRAFKHTSVAGYELPWNQQQFNPNFFIRISQENLQKKISALKKYSSQAHRNYMNEDFTRSLACVRGVQCNSQFAEAFEIHKLIANS